MRGGKFSAISLLGSDGILHSSWSVPAFLNGKKALFHSRGGWVGMVQNSSLFSMQWTKRYLSSHYTLHAYRDRQKGASYILYTYTIVIHVTLLELHFDCLPTQRNNGYSNCMGLPRFLLLHLMLFYLTRCYSYRRLSIFCRKSGGVMTKGSIHFRVNEEEEELFDTIKRAVAQQNLGTTVRVAGGWVRDRLLGLSGKNDIDLALDNMSGSAFAEALADWYTKNGKPNLKYHIVQYNPDKSKHLETATMRLGKFDVDAVQLRTDTYTESSRIPLVSYGTPLEDALRRDLTINSLFYNIHSEAVEDFTGRGLEDLQLGLIRTPLPALVTLRDDPLRAFRAVRFACRFNFTLCEELESACVDPSVHLALLEKVSAERISQEIHQMLDHPSGASRAMLLLHKLHLLKCMLPQPPSRCLEYTDADCAADQGVVGSAGRGPSCLFNLDNMQENAVNLLMTAHLLSLVPDLACEESSQTDAERRDERLLRYAALSLPGYGLEYVGPSTADGSSSAKASSKRTRPMPFARHICIHQCHIGKVDYAHVDAVHTAAKALKGQLTELASALWGGTPLTAPFTVDEKNCANHWDIRQAPITADGVGGPHWGPMDRVRLGFIVRQATSAHFSQALTLACSCLAVESLAAHFASCPTSTPPSLRLTKLLVRQLRHRGVGMSATTGHDGDDDTEDAVWEAVYDRCAHLREVLDRAVDQLDLRGEMLKPPLPLSGHDYKRLLPNIPVNAFSDVARAQTEYYLANWPCLPADIENYLGEKFAEFK